MGKWNFWYFFPGRVRGIKVMKVPKKGFYRTTSPLLWVRRYIRPDVYSYARLEPVTCSRNIRLLGTNCSDLRLNPLNLTRIDSLIHEISAIIPSNPLYLKLFPEIPHSSLYVVIQLVPTSVVREIEISKHQTE